jgi:acyl-lipid omega-6 desaturase (Delta-12 desaturase)
MALGGSVVECTKGRSGRELIEATRSFASESPGRSWVYLLSTVALLAAGTVLAALPQLPWPLRLALAVWNGLVMVRTFILFHDHMHGALLANSRIARSILYPFGVLVMTPPRVWRETHNYHHAHTAKLVGSNIGSFAMMSTTQWALASKTERRHYRLVRHPLTILFGYFTIFMSDMCLASFIRSPRKRWDSLVALLINWGLSALLIWRLGIAGWIFSYFLPLFLACCMGAYLFYAQHNYPAAHIQPRECWSFDRAALESSSYMETGRLMGWVTGNIGYHNVHHLNPCIPFYRLPEAMRAIPELQAAGKTSLAPADIAAAFRLKLWDAELGKLVGFPPG